MDWNYSNTQIRDDRLAGLELGRNGARLPWVGCARLVALFFWTMPDVRLETNLGNASRYETFYQRLKRTPDFSLRWHASRVVDGHRTLIRLQQGWPRRHAKVASAFALAFAENARRRSGVALVPIRKVAWTS